MSEQGPPTHLVSDFVELTYLVVFFSIGAPLNLIACQQLSNMELRNNYNRLQILKRHLNFTDLFVMLIFIPSRVCWIITYSWQGGDLLCRFIKFSHAFAFQASSNVIVCIAIDRLMSVFFPIQMSRKRGIKRVKFLLSIGWFFSVLTTSPQLFVWQTFQPFPHWTQCTQIWIIDRHRQQIELPIKLTHNISNESESNLFFSPYEKMYHKFHLIVIFWCPATIIIVCYVVVSFWVFKTSQYPQPQQNRRYPSFKYSQGSVRSTVTSYFPSNAKKESIYRKMTTNVTTNETNDVTTRTVTFNTTDDEDNERRVNIRKVRRRVRRSAVRISFLLVAAYGVCWLPYNCMALWKLIDPQSYKESDEKFYFLHALIVFNSVINPFLYGTFGKVHKFARNG